MYKQILILCSVVAVAGAGIFFLFVNYTKDPAHILSVGEPVLLQDSVTSVSSSVSILDEQSTSSDPIEEDFIDDLDKDYSKINQQLLVAHAMGTIATTTTDGTGTNSLEAFLYSYEQGFRIFETDIVITKDDQAFMLHDGTEPLIGLEAGQTYRSVSSSEIIGKKFRNAFTILSWHDALELLVKYPDVSFVLDIKDEFAKTLEILSSDPLFAVDSIKRGIVPQVYQEEDMRVVQSYLFNDVIFTLYRTNLTDEEVVALVDKYPEITVVTMWWDKRYNDNLAILLRDRGVGTYVHTPNKKKDVRSFLNKGIGVYTDVFFK